jgi:hypothetical protein
MRSEATRESKGSKHVKRNRSETDRGDEQEHLIIGRVADPESAFLRT